MSNPQDGPKKATLAAQWIQFQLWVHIISDLSTLIHDWLILQFQKQFHNCTSITDMDTNIW